eukprot:Sspe_Gene.80971::Locus_51477_Transcript_1_1_Confidence_1.000_Length_1203::g.80971::m.80971
MPLPRRQPLILSLTMGRPGCWSKEEFKNGKCNHCGLEMANDSGTRLKKHLAQCTKAPPSIVSKAEAKEPKKREAGAVGVVAKKLRVALAIPVPSASEMEAINAAWSNYFYSCATPFSHIENEFFLKAIQATRPGLKESLLLNRKQLGGPQLDKAYEAAMTPIRDLVKKTDLLHLLTDAWQTERGDKLFAVCVRIGDLHQAYASGELVESTHTAEELIGHLQDLPDEVTSAAFSITSDGDSTACSAGKKFCEMQKAKGVEMHHLICGAHTVMRCVNDLVGTRQERNKDVNNPFTHIHRQITSAVGQLRNTEAIRKRYGQHPPVLQDSPLPQVRTTPEGWWPEEGQEGAGTLHHPMD